MTIAKFKKRKNNILYKDLSFWLIAIWYTKKTVKKLFIYDKKILKSLFESVGFSDVKSYLISESEDENLKNLENINDSENRGQGQTKEFLQLETFTLEATKWKK